MQMFLTYCKELNHIIKLNIETEILKYEWNCNETTRENMLNLYIVVYTAR